MDQLNRTDTELVSLNLAVKVRIGMSVVNEHMLAGKFSIPIHLAFGHELLAVAVADARSKGDLLVLSHRNMHYHLALGTPIAELLDEYALSPNGISQGQHGSMNLSQSSRGCAYTSSILGNNLSISVGLGLGQKVRNLHTAVWVQTGDGAIEEGAFTECLLLASSLKIPLVIIVENNQWSLATSISERRTPIDVASLAAAYGVSYIAADTCDFASLRHNIQTARENALASQLPVIVEVNLRTLGGRWAPDEAAIEGKRYINYHAGAIPGVDLSSLRPGMWVEVDPLDEYMFELESSGHLAVLKDSVKESLS